MYTTNKMYLIIFIKFQEKSFTEEYSHIPLGGREWSATTETPSVSNMPIIFILRVANMLS